ncbi:MAG: anaerobic carbon-monoxide dehydrogenase catalytic subunit [Planctomycetota bacterium]
MAQEQKAYNAACQQMISSLCEKGIETCWDREDKQRPHCAFGNQGICCKICYMGPCRITKKADKGVCGANADTIAARNFARMAAAGAAAHSDHGRDAAHVFLETAKGNMKGYEIKDTQKLLDVAGHLGVEVEGKSIKDIAIKVGELALAEFGKPHGTQLMSKRAPAERQKIWDSLGVRPRSIDREVVQIMHLTHMGVDEDYRDIMLHATRCALADGWGGSMLATELQDILFKTPKPLRSAVNFGVLKEDHINIIVHGHEPLLSEMIVVASNDSEMLELAKKKGAKGIILAGICCTANEILMRHGIPIAGNFLQQELAIGTGAVDAMVVDVQCIMPGIIHIASCFHTKVITTSPKAKMEGATHIEFNEESPIISAKAIVKAAIENFPNRKKELVHIPKEKMDLIAGFSHESVIHMLGGSFRTGYRALNDNIINGKIRGVAGVVGCCNPKTTHNKNHVELVKHLIKNDVLVLQTGCSAIAAATAGLLIPEAAEEFAGPGLAEICRAVGCPPVLHCGSCVDNTRLLIAAAGVVREGGLGNDISALPLAGAAPEWMSEKAIAIGQYFVASGVFVVFGIGLPVTGAPRFSEYLFNGIESDFGGKWAVGENAEEMAKLMIDHIDKKRQALGIDKKQERVLFDMEMRRQLEV